MDLPRPSSNTDLLPGIVSLNEYELFHRKENMPRPPPNANQLHKCLKPYFPRRYLKMTRSESVLEEEVKKMLGEYSNILLNDGT
jgi:hypothetical protein